MKRKIIDQASEKLRFALECEIIDLANNTDEIKKHTDRWVEAQKNIINLQNTLDKLGYSYKIKKWRGRIYDMNMCDVEITGQYEK